MLTIALNIAFQLCVPVVRIRSRSCSKWTSVRTVLMPEASMDEDCLSSAAKHDVRLAWQFLRMQSEAVSESVEQGANSKFRAGMRVLVAPHGCRDGS